MRFAVREKRNRGKRRARTVKPEPGLDNHDHNDNNFSNDNNNATEITSVEKPMTETGLWSVNYQTGLNNSGRIPNPNSNPNISAFDDGDCDYCTEEQLEQILLRNLDFLYSEAMEKLVGLGYHEGMALKAILRNGHCYGEMDVLSNIVRNSLAYLNNENSADSPSDESKLVFTHLRQLEEYSLAGMVSLLQQIKPHLSRGDAMWCLLMSDLHVGRASVMEIPVLQSPSGNMCGSSSDGSGTLSGDVEGVNDSPVGVAPTLHRFDGAWRSGNDGTLAFSMSGFFSNTSDMALQREIECPEKFNVSPSMKTLLKKNVAAFAAGYRANSKQLQNHLQVCASFLSSQDSLGIGGIGDESHVGRNEESWKNQDAVNLVLTKFRDLKLDEKAEHGSSVQKDDMLVSMINQINDLERRVKERREWAHQRAIQAARKLSHDLAELKILRMEREETQRLKKGKQILEDATMKRLSEMENGLRRASVQVDRVNAAVGKLESENAEIRAEMEAFKLSASESVRACLEVEKREKNYLKRFVAWEKQETKLKEDIAAEKQKIANLQQQLVQVEAAQKETDEKWRQEQKAKELALEQVKEEQWLKEAAKASRKSKLKALRLKIEIDFQHSKDDLQWREQELSRLKASAQYTEAQCETNSAGNSGDINPQGDAIWRLLDKFDKLEDPSEKGSSYDRECLICRKDEVSVVFLPCAHQVLCANCNNIYTNKGKATCPCCQVPIEQRICVFGAASS